MRIKFSLLIKAIIGVTVLILTVAVILSFGFIVYSQKIIYSELKERGMMLASNLAHDAELGVLTLNHSTLDDLLKGVMQQSDAAYCLIQDMEEKIIVQQGFKEDIANSIDYQRAIREDRNTAETTVQSFKLPSGRTFYRIRALISSLEIDTQETEMMFLSEDSVFPSKNKKSSGKKHIGYVQLGISLDRADLLIEKTIRAVSLTTIGIVVVAASITAFFFRLILIPISHLVVGTQKIAEGDLNYQVDVKTQDEFQWLAESFNNMIQQLRHSMVSIKVLEEEVTERKFSQEALKKEREIAIEMAKKAQVAAETKSQFLANMSHEIRTPMNSILGFSDLLSQTDLDEEQTDFIATVKSSGHVLLELIDDILDFSKIEAGKIMLENIDFNIEYLIVDVFKMMTSKLEDKKIETYIDIDSNVPRDINGDPTRLRQIFINFFSNAIKFTSEGDIGIKINLEEKRENNKEYVFRFTIQDTGIGIPKDKQEKIFKTFSQADMSTTREFGGTGLGLAICKALIQAMQGKVWVESEINKGSRFIFTACFREAEIIDSSEMSPTIKKELKNKRIMIIDDNRIAQKILKKYCHELGFNILSIVDSTESALHQIDQFAQENNLPDLILSDLMMPGMNGYQLIEKIRTHHKYKFIKAIAMTHDLEIGVSQKTQDKGFDGFLSKPFVKNELEKTVMTVFTDDHNKTPKVSYDETKELICQGIKILAVEDNESNQQLLRTYFKKLGCVSEFANNGGEAIEKLKFNQYDLCLMDLDMPVMDGEKATRIIRKKISENIPIIALTSAVLEGDREKCLKAGMNDYLSKPINITKLEEKILQYINPITKLRGIQKNKI